MINQIINIVFSSPFSVRLILRKLYAIRCLHKMYFHKGCIFKDTTLGGMNTLFANARIYNSSIGIGTYIGKNSEINYASIGKFCSIADCVHIGFGSHPGNYVSMHPSTYYDTTQVLGYTFADTTLFNPYKWIDKNNKKLVDIGNDVWIGSRVMIMDGVSIGHGAIIAAGAVVTKDIEPYAVVGGVPAKFIKYRFDEEYRRFLLQFKWWNRDLIWIKDNYKKFIDVNEFYMEYSKEIQ